MIFNTAEVIIIYTYSLKYSFNGFEFFILIVKANQQIFKDLRIAWVETANNKWLGIKNSSFKDKFKNSHLCPYAADRFK